MDQPAPDPPEANPKTRQALADQYIDRLSSVENFAVIVATEFWLLRRLGLDPSGLPGRLIGGTFHFLVALLPALILTAIAGEGLGASLAVLIICAVGWGGFWGIVPLVYKAIIPNHLSWVRLIVDERDLRRLIVWGRRWYSCRVVAAVAAALTLGTVVPFYLLAVRASAVRMPVGYLYVGTLIAFGVMLSAFANTLMAPEAHNLSNYNYRLYRLSPVDSIHVRRSLLGYSQQGLVNVVASTLGTLFLLLLLPAGSGLVAPVILFLLLLEYLCTAVGTLLPRSLLGRIIRRSKEAEMETLQVQLDELLPRVQELSEEEYEEMTRLQKVHDTIRDSPENLLPLGAILRTVGALFLSTATILVTAFAQEWIAEWAKGLVP